MFVVPEIIDIIIIIAALGFIFRDTFAPKINELSAEEYDPLKPNHKSSQLEGFKIAAMVAAPAIILHELGHKFVAMYFGLAATFNAAYSWLLLGILLKMLNSSFLFFVPAYVSIPDGASPLQSSAIAFAGPAVNLLLFLVSFVWLKWAAPKGTRMLRVLTLTKQMNMFLFIFNMLPFFFFDGYKVFLGLYQAFF